jgi:long-chain acyl-CoA synthetase
MSLDVTPFLEVVPAPRVVFRQLAERGDRPRFFRHGADGGWAPVTWNQYAEQIRRVASFLAAAGLARGDRVALFGANSVEWGSAALGAIAAGGVMVPIYPASTPEQAGFIARHSDARAVFVDSAALLGRIAAAWPEWAAVERIVLLADFDIGPALAGVDRAVAGAIDTRLVRWPRLMRTGGDDVAAAVDAMVDATCLDDPCVMLYTSGTSGTPKGVPLTHNNVGINGRGWLLCNQGDLHTDGVDLLWLPMSHIFGFGEMCLGNTLGFTSYLASPAEVLELMPAIRPTVFMSVPAYWEKLARAALAEGDPEAQRRRLVERTGGRLRFCLSGGAGLPQEVKELFYRCGVLLIEGYGLTETSPTLTLNRRDGFRFDSVGRPLDSVELRLDADGEILARGPCVFAGYHKDPEATAAAFTDDGWFRTGDVGRFTDDGFLQIVDRKKDILVTAGGKNIPPANIEILFRDDPVIEHAVVYGDGKSYLVAGLWLAPGARVDADDLAARVATVNARLARHETIKRFAVIDTPLTVEAGLLTASLKLRRKQVYAAFRDRFEALYRTEEPSR